MAGKEQFKQSNKKSLRVMIVVVALMFGFGYALVPLYDLLCDITGLNGKTGRISATEVNRDITLAVTQHFSLKDRWVTVQFISNTGPGLPWEFRPLVNKVRVRPGEQTVVEFVVRNTSNETITGQAVPSVVPSRAARHFKKIECFCFSNQQLKPGETKKMPVRFVVEPKLDKRVDTIVLSYMFFNTDKESVKRLSMGKNENAAVQTARKN